MGKYRSCKGGRAHDDMVFLDRLHVRRSFFFFGEKETRECEPDGHPFFENTGTLSHSPQSSFGVPSRPETLPRCVWPPSDF